MSLSNQHTNPMNDATPHLDKTKGGTPNTSVGYPLSSHPSDHLMRASQDWQAANSQPVPRASFQHTAPVWHYPLKLVCPDPVSLQPALHFDTLGHKNSVTGLLLLMSYLSLIQVNLVADQIWISALAFCKAPLNPAAALTLGHSGPVLSLCEVWSVIWELILVIKIGIKPALPMAMNIKWHQ